MSLPPNYQRPHEQQLNVLCEPQLECKPYVPYHDVTALVENVQVANNGNGYISQNQQGVQVFIWDHLIIVLYYERVSGPLWTLCTYV